MARYRGPRLKKCRQVGVVLPGLTNKGALKRPFPPGQHGTRRKGKQSDFKERMVEKQKMRFHYGILEKQFRRYVAEASRRKGPTGRILVTLLESRLDSVVWRMGLGATIPAARQLVGHGHITVNGVRTDRPSFQVKPGDVVAIHPKSKTKPFIQANLEQAASRVRPGFLEFDPAQAAGKMVVQPEREDLPFECEPQKIVEFYSQQL
ncbi:MAG: 30S ribosomal protein S4 [Myxococcota bacterium]